MSISADYEKAFETIENHNTGADTRAPFHHRPIRLSSAATYSSDVVAFGIIVLVAVWGLLGNDTMAGNDVNLIGPKKLYELIGFRSLSRPASVG